MNRTIEDGQDQADFTRAQRLQNLLSEPMTLSPDDPLPPLFHWLHFPTDTRLSDLGPDGHPRRDSTGPGANLPRRMWAGSTVKFLKPVRNGAQLKRTSHIEDVTEKDGKSGQLCFVTIVHQIEADNEIAVIDSQQIVYRSGPQPGEIPRMERPEKKATGIETIEPSPVMLFRYSALTYNGHRIHYDRPYATEVEGYQGLVVHGPLVATMLLDLAMRQAGNRKPASFSFRAKAPLFDTMPFAICAGSPEPEMDVWALTPSGDLALSAKVVF